MAHGITRLGVVLILGLFWSEIFLGSGPPQVFGEMPEIASAASKLTASRLAADETLTWHDELETGWRESKATGRPMLIFITSEKCVYCDAMKHNTLCDESVRKRLLARFVPIRLRPSENNRELSRIKITAYPTTLVAYPLGKVATHRIGYQGVADFHQMLSEVDRADASTTVR